MNDLNTLLVPWTIERTAKPFPKPEILVANRIIRTGVKTSPEALEAAVSEVLANHQALLAELFKRVSDDAKQLVKTHRTAKEDFKAFWKRLFCQRSQSPATDTSGYLRNLTAEVFGGTPVLSLDNMFLLLKFFYQSVEVAFCGKSSERFMVAIPSEHCYDQYCFKYLKTKGDTV